ncbi:hypothetical protein THAOC_19833 [Thalassiosira oceanica]|uniref:Uncharacterized protein n=1 Tax=Thalassiosira oceanica TaxID=159749 RepID=K0SN42_THAOC|nr:hypothetical protein THAOC_19833 [Thalassiosira oceanica]|eukprot:EJK59892.1 hypothetical protein THAOC_19833 [Thalassiosira oceanica]
MGCIDGSLAPFRSDRTAGGAVSPRVVLAAPIDRLWSLDESLAPHRSDPRRGGAGSCGVMMGVPPAAEARQITGGPSSSTVEPIQRGPVSPLDHSGSRDGSPPISRPGMRRMNPRACRDPSEAGGPEAGVECSMRSMATKLDQNKVDSVMASGRKSLVNTMILSDAAEAQAQSKDAPRVLTLRGCWIGFPVTNNTKALFAVGSQALKADVVSMGVDAISYFGNICGECPHYPSQRIVTQLLFSLISLALLLGFNTQIIMESIDMVRTGDEEESTKTEGIIVITFAGLGLIFDTICLSFYRYFALKQAKEDCEKAASERNASKALSGGAEAQETAVDDTDNAHIEKPQVNMLSALLHVSADLFRSTSTFILGILMVSGALTTDQQSQGDAILGIYALYEWIIATRKWFYALAQVDMGSLEEKGTAAEALLG